MRYYQHTSQKAEWSARIGVLFMFLFLLTYGFHRFSQISTPSAMQLFGVAVAGAVVAVGLGIAAFVNIWRDGHLGAGNASIGVIFGMAMLVMPLWSLPALLTLPRIHEVSTDTERPPAFDHLASPRHSAGANPAVYQREAAVLQLKAYPDIKPLMISRPSEDAYSAVLEAVKHLKWNVISEQPPSQTQSGMIEATDHTMIFGFVDDVVIRVSNTGRESRVDVRSSSRHGEHDLGRNAQRVRTLFSEVKYRLNEVEKVERMERAVTLREKRVKKALAEKEAAAKERARQERLARRTASQQSSRGTSGLGDADSAQNRSQSADQDVQAQSRRQQQQGKRKGLGKFWELLTR